jgi:starch-binding outer membrane protein, SusD/RagB family
MQLFAELMAADGEITWVGTFNQPREIFGKNILTTNTFVRDNWSGGYYTINVANSVLSAIGKVLAADQPRVEGEALFIRGAVYFELVRFFAKPYTAGSVTTNPGVPLVLTPTKAITEQSRVSRATVAEVYQQVIADLTKAEAQLPTSNGVYASKVAAAAILSRVYLQMEDFQKARDAANRAIGYGRHSLTATVEEAFNNAGNSTEDIFALQVNAQDGNNNMQLYWSIPDFGVEILDKHLDLYDPDDARLALFYVGNGAVRSGKWKNQFTVLPVIRLAEMYLTRAEANQRLGTAVGDSPLNDINLIRTRAGLPELTTVTLADILLERKLELAHEGHAIHDLKRLRGTADGFAYNDNKMVFPIPQRERNANPNLSQNDGY